MRGDGIGVFDSGVGGLTVLKAIRELLPEENLIYLGDTARLPYGTKSAQSVLRYALQATRILDQRGIKMMVVACNTASAFALDALAASHPGLPVIGVIGPGAEAACATSQSGHIGVMATESTVRAQAYPQAINKLRADAVVHTVASPLLVGMAEEGWLEGPVPEAIVEHYLRPLLAKFTDHKLDCLVLGCTHFPVLSGIFQKVAGNGVTLVDSAHTTATEVQRVLDERGLRAKGEGSTRYLATDDVERFARVGSIFLGRSLTPQQVELVDL